MKISIKTITIILIMGIIIALIIINLDNKNTNIKKQIDSKEQLGETDDSAYVEIGTHLSEVNAQEEKLVSFKTRIAEAITEKGVQTANNADADTMATNIRSISSSEENPYSKYIWGNPYMDNTGGYGYLLANKNTLVSTSMFDVTDMNTLHINLKALPHVSDGTAYSQTKWSVGINKDQNTTSTNFVGVQGQTSGTAPTSGWYTIDVSNCTGDYYFVMTSSATGGSGWYASFYVYTVYFD